MASIVSLTIGLLVAAAVAPHIYGRIGVLLDSYSNRPSNLKRYHALFDFKIEHADVAVNCEDATLDEANGWAVLSCDSTRDIWNTVMGVFEPHNVSGGALMLYNYAGVHSSPVLAPLTLLDFPTADTDFHPLGIDLDVPSQTLFVANHAQSGPSIEVFSLSPSTASATHMKTHTGRDLNTPNSILALSSTEFLFTNDHTFRIRHAWFAAQVETYLGTPTGNLMHYDMTTGRATQLARLSFANGIAMIDSSTIAVASTNTNTVLIYRFDRIALKVELKETVHVGFMPDNLSVDGEGALLIAGHGNILAFDTVTHSRSRCASEEGKRDANCDVRGPSLIAEWREGQELKNLYVDDEFMTSTAAFRDTTKGKAFAMGVYEKGLLTWDQ